MATATRPAASVEPRSAYLMALTDWLACASAGTGERAARAVRASGDDLLADVALAATAGHVLDFDDTLAAGVAHVSSTTAPAALVLAAHRGLSSQAALDAYAEGYEAMAAVAIASHPSLYDAGWHPTAVCGPIGAVVAASRLLGLTPEQHQNAIAVALLRAGGTRGAFGSDGKAIQVGLAAAAGVQAAILAGAGARVDPRAVHGPLGFEAVLGAAWPRAGLDGGEPAITQNWIKLHPSCLGTHSPIDAASQAREALSGGPVRVAVHPVARQAAHLDAVSDGLSAKFSIPYCVAHTILHGPPRVGDFESIDGRVAARAAEVSVSVDDSLPQWGAVVGSPGRPPVRVDSPRGTPDRPLSRSELASKVADLAGERLLVALRICRARRPVRCGRRGWSCRPLAPSVPTTFVEHAAHNAMDEPDEIELFYDRCSDLMRELLDALAAAPDRPRPFADIEDSMGWPHRRIAAVLGGVSHLRQTGFAGRRPYRFHDTRQSASGRWEIWMDAVQAGAVQAARG